VTKIHFADAVTVVQHSLALWDAVIFSLEPYKSVLWTWYILEDHSVQDIHQLFHEYFVQGIIDSNCNNISYPSVHTVQCHLNTWSFKKRNLLAELDFHALKHVLWIFFCQWGLTDTEIMRFMTKRSYRLTMREYAIHPPFWNLLQKFFW
jgi:hypothetical protein